MFEQAIDKDPNFALAYTGLADSSLHMYGESKEGIWAQKATLAAQQAERLSNNLPEVHLSLGSVYSTTGKNTQAIAELKRALELAPNSDEAYRSLGDAYSRSGQSDEAIAAYQKAVAANPYYWSNHIALGNAYFRLGDNAKSAAGVSEGYRTRPRQSHGLRRHRLGLPARRQVERGHSAISRRPSHRPGLANVFQPGHRLFLAEETTTRPPRCTKRRSR